MSSSLANIIEQSIKNLDSLPTTVQRNMTEIRRLDVACQRMTLDAQAKVRQLISVWKNAGKEQRKKLTDALKADFAKMREFSDEKIRLSEQTYELVDKYIIKLDNDTAKLNAAVRRKFADNSAVAGAFDATEAEGGTRKRKNSAARKEGGKRMKKADRLEMISTQDAQPYSNASAPLVDMPVDPNEPTYCTCRQVSFGQMVMCDNKSCPIEWFHFQCVGLVTKPRGKWYCESCTELRRKKA